MGDSHKIDARGSLSPRVGVQIGDFGLSEGVQDEKLILSFIKSGYCSKVGARAKEIALGQTFSA